MGGASGGPRFDISRVRPPLVRSVLAVAADDRASVMAANSANSGAGTGTRKLAGQAGHNEAVGDVRPVGASRRWQRHNYWIL